MSFRSLYFYNGGPISDDLSRYYEDVKHWWQSLNKASLSTNVLWTPLRALCCSVPGPVLQYSLHSAIKHESVFLLWGCYMQRCYKETGEASLRITYFLDQCFAESLPWQTPWCTGYVLISSLASRNAVRILLSPQARASSCFQTPLLFLSVTPQVLHIKPVGIYEHKCHENASLPFGVPGLRS